MELPLTNEIVTSCRDCRFAECRGDTQVGCLFGRLEKFEAQGAEVVGLDDGERKFMSIRGRVCTAERWSRKHPEAAGLPDSEAMRLARDSFCGQCTFLIYVPAGAVVADLLASVRSVAVQSPAPKAIKILHGNDNPDWPSYNVAVRALGIECPYRFYRIEPPTDEQEAAYGGDPYLRACDIGAAESDSVFYTAARAAYEWHPDFLRRIDHALNDEMVRFVALRPEPLFMQGGLHGGLGGNREGDILAKLDEIVAAEGTGHLIKRWEDLPDVETA